MEKVSVLYSCLRRPTTAHPPSENPGYADATTNHRATDDRYKNASNAMLRTHAPSGEWPQNHHAIVRKTHEYHRIPYVVSQYLPSVSTPSTTHTVRPLSKFQSFTFSRTRTPDRRPSRLVVAIQYVPSGLPSRGAGNLAPRYTGQYTKSLAFVLLVASASLAAAAAAAGQAPPSLISAS